MKNIANYVSISRILMSIILSFTETFSILFYIIYIYCGISDMIFVIVAIIKILPILNLSNGIIVWGIIIALIKICNVICGFIYYKKLILLHTIANKITGFVLFIAPLIIVNANFILFEIAICMISTFSAIQEGHFIRTRKMKIN